MDLGPCWRPATMAKEESDDMRKLSLIGSGSWMSLSWGRLLLTIKLHSTNGMGEGASKGGARRAEGFSLVLGSEGLCICGIWEPIRQDLWECS